MYDQIETEAKVDFSNMRFIRKESEHAQCIMGILLTMQNLIQFCNC
jgi:hypothetical protein